jgi:hypothetical protein
MPRPPYRGLWQLIRRRNIAVPSARTIFDEDISNDCHERGR